MHQTRRNQIAQWSKKARQTNALGSRALHAPVEADPEAADDNEEAVGGVQSPIPLNGGGGRGWKDAGRSGGAGTERGGLGASKLQLETAGESTASAPLHGRKNHHDHTKKKKRRGHSARDDEYDDGADDAEEEDGDAEEGDGGAEDDDDAESEDGSYSQFRLDDERGRDQKKEKPKNK